MPAGTEASKGDTILHIPEIVWQHYSFSTILEDVKGKTCLIDELHKTFSCDEHKPTKQMEKGFLPNFEASGAIFLI